MQIIITSPNLEDYEIASYSVPFRVGNHLEMCVINKKSYETGCVKMWDLACYIFHGHRMICSECDAKYYHDAKLLREL